jgi:hypothetical protein
MSKKWRKTKEINKLLAIEGPGIKRITYVYSLLSSLLNFYGVELYEQGTYPWYEGNIPMLIVTFALVLATVNFIINSSLFILKSAVKGRISKLQLFFVFTPFIFMFINLIRHPLLYSIPILGVLYFLGTGGIPRKKGLLKSLHKLSFNFS